MATTVDPTDAKPAESAGEAISYLESFINKPLHVQTTDGRLFVGQLKCTDNERNLILAMTHEYRQPTESDVRLAAERHERLGGTGKGNVKVEMRKRFVGLVVVPGRFIVRMEVEE